MYDPIMNASFSLSNQQAVSDGRWYNGEPIWNTVQRQVCIKKNKKHRIKKNSIPHLFFFVTKQPSPTLSCIHTTSFCEQGLRSATLFWPGSEAAIGGIRPTYWLPYNASMPYVDRVDQLLQWLQLPSEQRPNLLT